MRRTFFYRCLRALNARLDNRLLVLAGRPEDQLPRVSRQVGADSVHISVETNPYGRERDERVRQALTTNGIDWALTSSP